MTNKFAVVTGASTGIGRAIAIELTKHGVFVALVARTINRLEETKKLIDAKNGKAKIFPCDLTNVDSINKLVDEIKKETSHINILINVAGIWHGENEVYAEKDFETFTQRVILDTFAVGTVAPTLLSHALIPLMKKGSSIINISGTFENGAKGWLPYYVSKRAIEDLTVGLAQELILKEIYVNCISPSDTATDAYRKYFPKYIREAIEPKEIASFLTNLCLHNTQRTTGQIFVLKKNQEPKIAFHS